MNKLFPALAAAFALASLSGTALAGGTAAVTALHPTLLSAPLYAAHADATRLVLAPERKPAAVTALHPALLGAPVFAAHADASALEAGNAGAAVQVVEKAE